MLKKPRKLALPSITKLSNDGSPLHVPLYRQYPFTEEEEGAVMSLLELMAERRGSTGKELDAYSSLRSVSRADFNLDTLSISHEALVPGQEDVDIQAGTAHFVGSFSTRAKAGILISRPTYISRKIVSITTTPVASPKATKPNQVRPHINEELDTTKPKSPKKKKKKKILPTSSSFIEEDEESPDVLPQETAEDGPEAVNPDEPESAGDEPAPTEPPATAKDKKGCTIQ